MTRLNPFRIPGRSHSDPPPLLVNTVVGFIGPEYLADGKQIIRAGLEDYRAAAGRDLEDDDRDLAVKLSCVVLAI